MALLLVTEVMDLRAMAVVAAITGERLAPAGERVARAIGAVVSPARPRYWRGDRGIS